MHQGMWRDEVVQLAKKARTKRSQRFQRAICKLQVPDQHCVLVQLNCYNPYNENAIEGMWMVARSETWMKCQHVEDIWKVDPEKSPYVLVQFENIRTDLDFHGYELGKKLNDHDFTNVNVLEKLKGFLDDQTLDETQTLELVSLIADGTLKKHVIIFSAVNLLARPLDKIYYFDHDGSLNGVLEFRPDGNLARVPIPPKSEDHLNKTMILTDMDSERYNGLTSKKDAKPFAISSIYEDMSDGFFYWMFYHHEFDINDLKIYTRGM